MNRPRIAGIIQARMGSARLPGKVLLPLAGRPMLQRLIERVSPARSLDRLVVATSDQRADDPIEALCRELDVAVFRGSAGDVLDRFLRAAAWVEAEVVVRLTGDNPLVDGTLVDDLVRGFLAADPPLAYAQNVDGSGFPLGLSLEVIALTALREAARSRDPLDREHVTRYVRHRPQRYPSWVMPCHVPLGGVSVTVDTRADHRRVKALFEAHYRRDRAFTYRDVLDALAGAEALAEP